MYQQRHRQHHTQKVGTCMVKIVSPLISLPPHLSPFFASLLFLILFEPTPFVLRPFNPSVGLGERCKLSLWF